MSNDKVFGLIMSIIGIAGILIEAILLIFSPLLSDYENLGGLAPSLWWAIAIPLFLGVSGVLGIVVWIGFTMIKTPPPEAWNFEDIESSETEEEKKD